MLKPEAQTAAYVYTGVLGMRVGMDRLAERVRAECNRAVTLSSQEMWEKMQVLSLRK